MTAEVIRKYTNDSKVEQTFSNICDAIVEPIILDNDISGIWIATYDLKGHIGNYYFENTNDYRYAIRCKN